MPVVILTTGFMASQNIEIDSIKKYAEKENWVKVDSILKKVNQSKLSDLDFSDYNYYKGKIYFNNGLYDRSYQILIESKKILENKKNEDYRLAQTLASVIECINYIYDEKANQATYIEQFCELASKLKDYKFLIDCEFFKGTFAFENSEIEKGISHYRNSTQIAIENKDSIKYYNNLINEGMFLGYYEEKPIEAIKIYDRIIPFFIKRNDKNRLFSSLINLSFQYYLINDNNKAINTLYKADTMTLKKDLLASKELLYLRLSQYHQSNKNYESALSYLKKSDSLKDIIRKDKQQSKVRIIEEELDNEKLKADNLETDAKRKRNLNIAIGLGGSLALGSIIAFLLFKNTKRKQKLAEQEKEIESQKLATVLKDQELNAIDAMIAGQEKERQRIANDLHDDLGGLMANVKLHFNALQDKDSPELFDKTNTLIEEAYQKVRSVAHAKNSGVIAKQGLLKAVENMADKISASNKIQIDVLDHGLDNRIENSLELTLFRIIQELITNVIKHAEATEATIHLTNHDDAINIMVEDNGKGFNPSQITKIKSGMGISSIDKRVEHLDGKLTIESEKNKGTTVIIDIPL
ncbi:sensor histidine kinase [uncultured Winogradskyella sp.]|uniref:sensor histidine kinase n=1 Tax=uncultured Winogradskyella sp. TaxID=395353 RepID=UPI00261B2EC7|nr:sensor histidine kinase [uncultured Winogradskyella sp.]